MTLNFSKTSEKFVFLDGLEPTISSPLLPNWFLWTYIGIIVLGGTVTNGIIAVCIAKKRILPAVLHLCLTDIASLLFLAPYEILLLSDVAGIWIFPRECCPVFLGIEVILGTATVYILIVINFSSATGNDKNSLKIPLLTVWLVAVSLSVPDFIFAEVVTPRPQYNICYLAKRAAFLIGVFRLALPVVLLLVGTVTVILVLFQCEQPKPNSLRLALILSLTYIAISVQRPVFGVLYGIIYPIPGPGAFRTPPIADVAHNPLCTLSLALIHYSLSAVRPIISWTSTPRLRSDTDSINNQVTEIDKAEQ
ncbi:hypothetical protein J6590_029740 [Homalodisca vitripennis]|nr:hypothetical protein J6590_029740 [Homalodisca vitripennis]